MGETLTDKYIGGLRCSGLGYCPKRLAAPFLQDCDAGESSNTPADSPRFRDGHWHEYDVKTRLLRDNVRFESGIKTVTKVNFRLNSTILVPGHLDGVIQVDGTSSLAPPGRWLLEAKSMNDGLYWKLLKQGYQEGFPSYYDQIQAYLSGEYHEQMLMPNDVDNPASPLYALLDYTEEETMRQLPAMGLVVAKNKGSGQLKVLPIITDDSYADGLRRRWLAAIESVDQLRWPERLYESPDNYECRSCPIGEVCWGEVVGVPAIVVPPTPDQEAAAKMYQFGKTLGKFAEQLQDASRPALEPDDPGKLVIGPIRLNKYSYKRVFWNHSLIERMLSPEQVQMVKIEKDGVATRIDVKEMLKEEFTEAVRVLLERPEAVKMLEEG